MKRVFAVLSIVGLVMLGACRNDPVAQPSPAPSTVGPAGQVPAGVLPPVDRTRDTVNQLNDLQNRTEQQTGGDTYTP
jgi:hypothetical protein